MTNRTGRLQIKGDTVDVGSAPATNGDGPSPAKESVQTADAAQHVQVESGSNLRLTVLFIIIVMVGAGAGYFGSLYLPKQYAARAEMQYNLSQAMPNELLREDRRLSTQLVLLRSREVLGPAASDNGITPEDLAENVSAEVVAGSEIIEVEVRDRTPGRAEMLLNRIVDRYLTVANDGWQDPIRSYLELQLDEVRKQLREPDVAASAATGLAQREQTLLGLLSSLPPTPSNSPESPGPPARVLTAPYPVATPVYPQPLVGAATGAATALVLAGFVVLLVARRRLRS